MPIYLDANSSIVFWTNLQKVRFEFLLALEALCLSENTLLGQEERKA